MLSLKMINNVMFILDSRFEKELWRGDEVSSIIKDKPSPIDKFFYQILGESI